jgi:hypothetical protein
MMKKGDVVINADIDDEVRSSVSQNHARTTLSAVFFPMTLYIALHSYHQRGERGADYRLST